MPHYQNRALTARDRLLVDKLSLYPRYAPLVARLTSTGPPAGKAAQAPAPAVPTTTPPAPATAATGDDSAKAAAPVAKPKPSGR